MTKITNRRVDNSYEIYLCLKQAVSGTEDEKNVYKQFSPDFFDLIVVDECHRDSAEGKAELNFLANCQIPCCRVDSLYEHFIETHDQESDNDPEGGGRSFADQAVLPAAL